MLEGLIVSPLAIVFVLELEMDFKACISLVTINEMFCLPQTIMLVIVTFERFIAIRFSLEYRGWIDTSRANHIAFFAWALNFTIFQVPLYIWNRGNDSYNQTCEVKAIVSETFVFHYEFLVLFLLPIMIMTCVYVYIWRISRKQQERFVKLYNRFNLNQQKRVRTTKTFALVFIVFIFTALPLRIYDMLLFSGIEVQWLENSDKIILKICLLLERVDALLNPFIYTNKNLRIRSYLCGYNKRNLLEFQSGVRPRRTTQVMIHNLTANFFEDMSVHLSDGKNEWSSSTRSKSITTQSSYTTTLREYSIGMILTTIKPEDTFLPRLSPLSQISDLSC